MRCRPRGKGKGKGKGKKKGKKMMRKREARDCFGRCEEDEKFTKEAVAKLNVKRESLGLPVGRVARVEAELKSQLPPTRFPSTVPTSGIVLARHALMECLYAEAMTPEKREQVEKLRGVVHRTREAMTPEKR